MKYFIVEGVIKNPSAMNESILKEHMEYNQKVMNQGLILMSTLKADMSGGLFIMKSESLEMVEKYLDAEPFKVAGIQEYSVIEFSSPHYFNQSSIEWFSF